MNSACPMGAPRTVRPCSVGGRAGLPTQTSEPNEVRLGGSWPAPFFFIFFSLAPFFRDWVSVSCFTGQLPGIGTVFILASLQMRSIPNSGIARVQLYAGVVEPLFVMD